MELSSFRSDILRRVSLVYIAWLVLAMFGAYALYKCDFGEPLNYVLPSILLYLFVVAVHVVRRVAHGGTANLLAPDVLFIGIYSVFHLGYLVMWVIGAVPYSDRIFYNEPTVPLSLFIINLGLLSAILGFEFFAAWARSTGVPQSVRIPAPGWGMTGLAVMILGLGMHVGSLLVAGPELILQQGYTAVANLGEHLGRPWSLFWSRSTQVFLIGVTIYTVYSSLRYRKLFASRACLALVVGMFVLLTLEGDRGPMFLIGLSILIVRQYLVKPIKLPILVVGAVCVLTLFTAMKTARGWAFSPGAMVAEWEYARSSGDVRWWSSIVEGGASFRNAGMTTMIVPDHQPYWYGRSWLSAAAKTVPLLQGQLGRMGILREAPSQWLTYEISGPGAAGLGFSLPLEGYLNLGLPGVIIQMVFFGAVLRWVCMWFARRPSAATALIMLGILAPTIKVVRDHSSLVTHIYVQVIVLAWLLSTFFGNEPERRVTTEGAGQRAGGQSVPHDGESALSGRRDPIA